MYGVLLDARLHLVGWPLATRLPHENEPPDEFPSEGPIVRKGINALKQAELFALAVALHTGTLRAVPNPQVVSTEVDGQG